MKTGFNRFARLRASLIIWGSVLGFAGWTQSVAIVTGTVTNSITGAPVTGVRISFNNDVGWSVLGGTYLLTVTSSGTFPVVCVKPGFDSYSTQPMSFQPAFTYTLNFSIPETANPPASVAAHLDTVTSPPLVPVTWNSPTGPYELLYDDGIQDNFTVWSVQGNQNALKFTPQGYPLRVTGGMINIGKASDYLAGSNPLVPFQVSVWDAGGPDGKPGSVLSGPFVVIPQAFGWIEFSIPNPPQVNSGSFYIAMTQGGNAPNAAGLAIDETSPQFRSYAHYVNGSGIWLPAQGNFMIRAIVNGPGGPALLSETPSLVTGYSIWRLKQGEEMNQAAWVPLGTTTLTHRTDSSWNQLPCGPYRWGVVAKYTGNRQSPVAFSNVTGKCWTVSTGVHVTLSCSTSEIQGTKVMLNNLVYPDTAYSGFVNSSGNITFPHTWKGSYELKVTRFGYSDLSQIISLSTDTLLQVFLLQEKAPPSGLVVHDNSLVAAWNKPEPEKIIFRESWESGSFSTNNWTTQGGSNWVVSASSGNPQPSAMFSWSPQVVNYQQSLVSRLLDGISSPVMKLKYDIFLDGHGTTSMNQMAVELWDGSAWHQLKNYTNANGDIQWTSQELDISAYTNTQFRIRFRAYGTDSYDINHWNVDNITIAGSESPSLTGECLLGYNFYLDNVICGFTEDTTYHIPPALVHYGGTYQACVAAVYGSGSSYPVCQSFTSRYLSPPGSLHGEGNYSTATLSWNQPSALLKNRVIPPGLAGYKVYRDGSLIATLTDPDSTQYKDYNLFPDTYGYEVSAVYDLTTYGYPGMEGESLPAGPVSVVILYGAQLPFSEFWDDGTFASNAWSFNPDPGNWLISFDDGNPAPAADFLADPVRTDYSYALESQVINAAGITCSKVWLDFEDLLVDQAAGSTEKLSVEIFSNGTWKFVAGEVNSGSRGWTGHHLDISFIRDKAFRIRFRASGASTSNLGKWELDNIRIYSECKPARDLSGDAQALDVRLTWNPPVCPDGFRLNEGFEESQFPPMNWTRLITNPVATWIHSDLSSPVGVHSGSYAARVPTDYNHQDEWLIASGVEVTGNLTFWSFGYQGSTHFDHYYVKISENQGASWDILFDLSALPPYPGPGGYNQWNEPYTVDLSPYLGQVVDLAWQVVDGDGQGAWYTWAIDDCRVGNGKNRLLITDVSSGKYDVYRQDIPGGTFQKINPSPVTDTTYLDQGLVPSVYSYYVASVPENCQQFIPSDTVLVDVVEGVREAGSGVPDCKIYPNPADDRLEIESGSEIQAVLLADLYGHFVRCMYTLVGKRVTMSLRDVPAGFYIVKITFKKGVVNRKVTIHH